MGIPVINYAAMQPQGDPFMQGLIPALQAGMQLKYAKPNMQADLQSKQLANALSQVQLNYADPMAQAKLSLNQAQLPYLQSQTTGQNLQNSLAQINLKNAPAMSDADLAIKQLQIPFTKKKMDLMPAQALAQLLSGAGRYNTSNWQSSPNAQLIRTLSNPQMQNLISNNPQVGASVTQTLGNIGLGNTGGNIGNNFQIPNGMLNSLMGGINQDTYGNVSPNTSSNNPSMDTGQQSVAPWAMPQQAPQENAQPSFQQGGFQPTPEDINAVRGAAGDTYLKKTRTAQQLNQSTYANTLKGIMDQGSSLMPSIVKYSGVLGQLGGKSDSALAQLKNSAPQDYINYRNFVDHIVPLAAGEMGRALGKNSTDEQTRMMKEVANPITWTNSPEIAMAEWHYLTNLFQNTIDPSVSSNNTNVYKNLQGQPVSQADVDRLTINPEQAQQLKNSGMATTSTKIGGRNYHYMNGQWMED